MRDPMLAYVQDNTVKVKIIPLAIRLQQLLLLVKMSASLGKKNSIGQ